MPTSPSGPISEMRVALTVGDFDAAVRFYRDIIGLEPSADWSSEHGRCILFNAGRATLELFDERQADYVDDVEVGRRVSGPVRLAFEVPDTGATVTRAEAAGLPVESPGRLTPWGDRNARIVAPMGLQLTLFST